jgi:hypothetical protein
LHPELARGDNPETLLAALSFLRRCPMVADSPSAERTHPPSEATPTESRTWWQFSLQTMFVLGCGWRFRIPFSFCV